MIAYILHPSCFYEIWALCLSWITCDHLYYAPCLVFWALFGSLVPAMCNRTSCAQVHKLPQSHCGDNQEGTLFLWLRICYAHLASVRFEHSVCHGLLMTTYIMLLPWLVEHSLFNSCSWAHDVYIHIHIVSTDSFKSTTTQKIYFKRLENEKCSSECSVLIYILNML